jgi:hypothetical protein
MANPQVQKPGSLERSVRRHIMVFDVESIGLHGEGFAVGFVVVDTEGNQHDCGAYACCPSAAQGSSEGHEWVKNNCPKLTITHQAPWQVRAAFWRKWHEWKAKDALLAADCCWPVEARFLARCVDDHPNEREWQGPYPLHDIASILLARDQDPLAKREREPDELPEHDPLADARQSARILLQALVPSNDQAQRPGHRDAGQT